MREVWELTDYIYKEDNRIINFNVRGTYSYNYDIKDNLHRKMVHDKLIPIIKSCIDSSLNKYQMLHKSSFEEFANFLKSNKYIYDINSKIATITKTDSITTWAIVIRDVCIISEEMKEVANENKNGPQIIDTSNSAKDGANKCPKCGATEISLNINNGKLRCNFCRHEFEVEKLTELNTDISKLQGQVIGSGASNIIADTNDIVTFKCQGCGAEVVIDTSSSTQARCHWCRHTLSINQQIPNGSVPDSVLPFKISKEDARKEIEKFVNKRKFFAHPKFKQEFTTENIMGVYFPYMVVDINSHAYFKGTGERQVRRYTVKNGDRTETRYDANLYEVERDFDFVINGLTVESNLERLNTTSKQTNNIINSIMPFDIENCVKYNANYLTGYTSEKRNTDVSQLHQLVEEQSKDIARIKTNDTLNYDRGVAWNKEDLDIKGEQWKAAYLPVWLYSYQDDKTKILHYVAVNARTKEIMGSIPIYMKKLLLFTLIIEAICFVAMLLGDYDSDWVLLFIGVAYFIFMYLRYRNSNARHKYEEDTKSTILNLRKVDNYVRKKTGLTSNIMSGANNKDVNAKNAGNKTFYALKKRK